ncbi:8-oxo-dGTP pyrophosphatase MutT, NUDIX family [Reichenbachiella faecimaris]|uniref:8-oxo-dGTP pyrophosphatase MutT, NUDIX family n=1 Tax=Reichenbachiella faecimaris TaxID=692418 RepID=A0A1W2GN03_REIFA|nr:CoA pyrophosphatase [Reichenbachiella faecimaris]SMD38043.1 8-oxo-dGTP pyrophosphatase MutT, NUDIX family [Reichenbachiella faecimaris]
MIDSSNWQTLKDALKTALKAEPLGMQAQIEMAPLPDVSQRFDKESAKKARQSAVMILLYHEDGKIKFPLIVRPQYPGVHSGQIALPGGKYEEEDKDLIYTALRETQEEVGVDMHQVEVIGQLSELYVPPSNFNILPVIGVLSEVPSFILEEKEVEELVIADIQVLNDQTKRKQKQMTFYNGINVEVPYFDIEERVVWGATAMILSEFATIINNINSKK